MHAYTQATDQAYRCSRRIDKFARLSGVNEDLRASDTNVLCIIEPHGRLDLPLRTAKPWTIIITDSYGLTWHAVRLDSSAYALPWSEGLELAKAYKPVPYQRVSEAELYNRSEGLQRSLTMLSGGLAPNGVNDLHRYLENM